MRERKKLFSTILATMTRYLANGVEKGAKAYHTGFGGLKKTATVGGSGVGHSDLLMVSTRVLFCWKRLPCVAVEGLRGAR
jgi:hypothetical protein